MTAPALEVYALYGFGHSLALAVAPDGGFDMAVSGNSSSLFPPAEMGDYSGPGARDAAALYDAIAQALPTLPQNLNPRPDSAFVAFSRAERAGTLRRGARLYNPPPPWKPLLQPLFGLVNDAFRKSPVRALAGAAVLSNPRPAARELPALALTLEHRGTEPLRAMSPWSPGRVRVTVIHDDSAQPALEGQPPRSARRTALRPDEVLLEPAPDGLRGDVVTVEPGARLEVVLRINRAIEYGNHTVRIEYESPMAPGDRHRIPGVRGGLVFEAPGLLLGPPQSVR